MDIRNIFDDRGTEGVAILERALEAIQKCLAISVIELSSVLGTLFKLTSVFINLDEPNSLTRLRPTEE